ncbi:hypothetical protein [Crocosphaera watsonii]|uniref:Nicotinate-nucleotide--dimethylbenzimidazole phosphoribosyltransferase n=1 Tax=Crocosphaera watsonii WH 0401 TaxID=555881 RepID=T2J893_CROWT|nr:hypothetical protein [Crocosphaera watsonii]CCQ61370.1 Nicotinate-nucleotide--dimethylbenzimidazole phosphoribosyltransferase [Crocosphaera watsonii WH 0401]
MLIEPTPTTLQTYYCHHCHGMIATTDISLINPVNTFHCPLCDQETLDLITQEDYENN